MPKLNKRESEIVDLLLDACGNKEIAKKLGIAPRTVKAHFNRLFMKFGITSGIKRVRLAVMIYQQRNSKGEQ